jgi:hypothetical protein
MEYGSNFEHCAPFAREALLEEYDRSGMRGVKFAQYLGIKYSTLAHWLQSRRRRRGREKLLLEARADAAVGKSTEGWIEAVVEGSAPRVSAGGSLRIYFAGGAYAQINSAGEAALAVELLGRLGAKR